MEDFENFHAFIHSTIQVVNSGKKKGKKVVANKNASGLRKAAHERRTVEQERTRQYKLQLESSGVSEMVEGIVINPGKSEDEDFIYINPHIARRLKPHQIDGVRFMWREIVTETDERKQGCLLAHTMGLGKTMQT